MASRGTSLELDRSDFEGGRWELHILEAHERGKEAKEAARARGVGAGAEGEGAAEVVGDEIEKWLKERK